MADAEARDPERRLKDANATRDAILASAKICFMGAGFEQVGVREIAVKAGVTAALINRYFGSKEALFGEVLDSGTGRRPDLETTFRMLMGERDRFGERLAKRILDHRESRADFDPMLVLLRSVGQPSIEALLRDRLAHWFEPLAANIGGPDAAVRAEMVLAILSGFDLFRNIIRSPALASADEDRVAGPFGAALQAVVDAPS